MQNSMQNEQFALVDVMSRSHVCPCPAKHETSRCWHTIGERGPAQRAADRRIMRHPDLAALCGCKVGCKRCWVCKRCFEQCLQAQAHADDDTDGGTGDGEDVDVGAVELRKAPPKRPLFEGQLVELAADINNAELQESWHSKRAARAAGSRENASDGFGRLEKYDTKAGKWVIQVPNTKKRVRLRRSEFTAYDQFATFQNRKYEVCVAERE